MFGYELSLGFSSDLLHRPQKGRQRRYPTYHARDASRSRQESNSSSGPRRNFTPAGTQQMPVRYQWIKRSRRVASDHANESHKRHLARECPSFGCHLTPAIRPLWLLTASSAGCGDPTRGRHLAAGRNTKFQGSYGKSTSNGVYPNRFHHFPIASFGWPIRSPRHNEIRFLFRLNLIGFP
jgi:hypothetical protein